MRLTHATFGSDAETLVGSLAKIVTPGNSFMRPRRWSAKAVTPADAKETRRKQIEKCRRTFVRSLLAVAVYLGILGLLAMTTTPNTIVFAGMSAATIMAVLAGLAQITGVITFFSMVGLVFFNHFDHT